MKINHINLFSLPVSDQQRAKQFYTEKLDFVVVRDMPYEADARWIQLAPREDSQTSVTLVTWFDDMPAGSLKGAVLNTDDIEAARAALAERGVEVSSVTEAPWGRFVTLKDPDGNQWIIQQDVAMPIPAPRPPTAEEQAEG